MFSEDPTTIFTQISRLSNLTHGLLFSPTRRKSLTNRCWLFAVFVCNLWQLFFRDYGLYTAFAVCQTLLRNSALLYLLDFFIYFVYIIIPQLLKNSKCPTFFTSHFLSKIFLTIFLFLFILFFFLFFIFFII